MQAFLSAVGAVISAMMAVLCGAIVKVAADRRDGYGVYMWGIGAIGAAALICAILLTAMTIRLS